MCVRVCLHKQNESDTQATSKTKQAFTLLADMARDPHGSDKKRHKREILTTINNINNRKEWSMMRHTNPKLIN